MAKELTVDAAVLDQWAREKGIPVDDLRELRERIDARQVERDRRRFWKRLMLALGFTAAIGGATAGGAYLVKKATDAIPETAVKVTERELGEREAMLKVKAEEVKAAAGVLMQKVAAFMEAIPASASNFATLQSGASAFLSGVSGMLGHYMGNGEVAPEELLHRMDEFLKNDPQLAPYWAAVSAAFDELKTKADSLAKMEGVLDITDTDKRQAWEDYKKILRAGIKEDFGIKAKALPTSARGPESRE